MFFFPTILFFGSMKSVTEEERPSFKGFEEDVVSRNAAYSAYAGRDGGKQSSNVMITYAVLAFGAFSLSNWILATNYIVLFKWGDEGLIT